jgi:hypothetical protein
LERPYLINAPLSIQFETLSNERRDEFEREFQTLSEVDSDAIGHWLKLQRAKGETGDTDEVVINLLVELHRKIDKLEKVILEGEKRFLHLENSSEIEKIGFHHFQLKESFLVKGEIYYGRVDMVTYPQREVALFFRAVDEKLVEIDSIHKKDEEDWASYFRARERIMIRERRK